MDILQKHEVFQIELLEKLNSGKFLEPLVFGGGTMLRLCYELNRYSVDLDFWFVRRVSEKSYFEKLKTYLESAYEVTDAQIKHFTLLFEVRSKDYPKRLKVEIRKKKKVCDFQERIAFSKYSTKQVMLKVHTPEQTMKNKVEAALERREIRDCFDLEFLLRQGVELTVSQDKLEQLEQVATSFKEKDFKVTLGSALDAETRMYYTKSRFSYLLEKIQSNLQKNTP